MKFNLEKCEAICESHMHVTILNHGKVLKTVERSKYLGVMVTNNSSWSLQVQLTMARKENKIVGLIKRMMGPKNREYVSLLFKSLVRPILG